MKWRRLIVALIFVLANLTLHSLIFVNAAGTPVFSLSVQKYVSDLKTFVPTASTTPGSVIRVAVQSSGLANLGGIRFRLTYNKDLFECQTYSINSLINDPKALLSPSCDATTGKVIVLWDTTTTNTSAVGDIFTLSFVAKAVSASTNAAFSLDVLDLYDSSYNNISAVKTASASVTISKITFDEPTLDLFRALSAISYPDSLAAIVSAETTFATFSSAQVAEFQNSYPDLYGYFIAARNTYSDLAAISNIQAYKDEAAKFRTDNARVLTLTVDTVQASDYSDVNIANTMYSNLSVYAKAYITQAEKDLLPALAAKAFHLTYARVLTLTTDTVQPSDYADVNTAYTMLGNLAATVKAAIPQSDKDLLPNLYTAIFSKSNARVLSLTVNTVQLSDAADVSAAKDMLSGLPKEIKALVPQTTKDLLSALTTKIADISAANDFTTIYGYFLGISDSAIKSSYKDLVAVFEEFQFAYDSLSDVSKSMVANIKTDFDSAKIKIMDYVKADTAYSALMEKVSAFKAKWAYVFSLEDYTVAPKDEAAIRMAIADYETQEEDVKTFLKSDKDKFENLLKTINSINKAITEKINKPVETKIVTETVTKNTTKNITKYVPKTITKVIETQVPQLIEKTSLLIRDVPTVIKVLCVLLLVSVLLSIYPSILFIRLMRKRGFFTGNGR